MTMYTSQNKDALSSVPIERLLCHDIRFFKHC